VLSPLKQQSVGRHVTILEHIVLILRANQLNNVYIAHKQQVFALIRKRLERTIYRTRGEQAKHNATDAVYLLH